ncbi:MAG: hypothetical protein ACFFBD_18080 [Candidatus Hodarchaeota archaeon]
MGRAYYVVGAFMAKTIDEHLGSNLLFGSNVLQNGMNKQSLYLKYRLKEPLF